MLTKKSVLVEVIIFYSKKSKDHLRIEGVVSKRLKPLKEKCCDKYKKGKRCKRCPCFDLL